MAAQERLKDEERKELLDAARRTLEVYFETGQRPVIESGSHVLLEMRGAFVTLHHGEELRGCIGTFDATSPLLETVQRMAVAAAISDPRFSPVQRDELAELTIEISVLSPLRDAKPTDIEIGVHGLHISQGRKRGVLLPQVATEHGWDAQSFLAHTCTKAGLAVTAWESPETRIQVFTADVFCDNE